MPMCPEIEVKEVKPGTKEAFWREAIVSWAESGLAQVEFCQVRGLSLATFRRYRTRLTRPASGSHSGKGDLIPATQVSAPTGGSLSVGPGTKVPVV